MDNAIINVFAWFVLGFSITIPVFFIIREILRIAK